MAPLRAMCARLRWLALLLNAGVFEMLWGKGIIDKEILCDKESVKVS